MKVELIWVTPDAERLVAYMARVSSSYQTNPDFEGLLRYLIRHSHWSPFEMVGMCVEIETSRAVSAQLLRHRSFHFQEFSQRYSDAMEFEEVELRKEVEGNRQSSRELTPLEAFWLGSPVTVVLTTIKQEYASLRASGVAKEVARMILPMCTRTRLYMYGSVRSWMHYLRVRCGPETQKEHRQVAEAIQEIFTEQFPTISKAVFNDTQRTG